MFYVAESSKCPSSWGDQIASDSKMSPPPNNQMHDTSGHTFRDIS